MKRAKHKPRTASKPRNPVARSPLLGKGGPHGKSASAKRQRANADLAKELRRLADE
jgi:hypothetical protein